MTVVRAEARDKNQTALAMAFPSPHRLDPRRFAAGLVAGIASGLGGRFFEELREKRSLAYTVQAVPAVRWKAGMFFSYIATSPDKEEVAREALLAEFERLRQEDVTEEELVRAMTYALGSHAIARQSGAFVLNEMVDAWLFGTGLSELDDYESRVQAVTVRQIRELAMENFDPERRAEGIVRGLRDPIAGSDRQSSP
jgi:zinc protease